MENEKIVHRRFIANSKAFYDELEKLGFIKKNIIGHGLNRVTIFEPKGELKGVLRKRILTSHDYLTLQVFSKKWQTSFKGLSIHDETLKFFIQRDFIKPNY